MKHSELPFSYKKQGKSAFYGIVSPDSDYYVAEELLEANAAFIVKACNEYYPLIRVVKALVEKLDADVWFLETAENEGICVESIKQIIKQAEES